jgi:hypothetical protein
MEVINFNDSKELIRERYNEYEDHVRDALDYWNDLKTKFDYTNKDNVEKYAEHIDLLSPHDKRKAQESLSQCFRMLKDRNLARETTMKVMLGHFDSKINNLNMSLEFYDVISSNLDVDNIDDTIYALLSSEFMYLKSRYQILVKDKAPIFSAFADNYEENERFKINREIEKHNLSLCFIKILLPFARMPEQKILPLLSYFPILSNYLKNPDAAVDLDDFMLDALSLVEHEVHLDFDHCFFVGFCKVPLVNLEKVKTLNLERVNELRDYWTNIQYPALVEKYAPKLCLAPEVIKPENKNTIQRSAKDCKRSAKDCKNQRKTKTNNRNKNKKKSAKSPCAYATSTPSPSPINDAWTAPQEIAIVSKEAKPFSKKQQRIVDRREQRAERRDLQKIVSEREELLLENNIANEELIHLGAHAPLIRALLEKTLRPTVRYEDIKHALEAGLHIRFEENRGNGDYRKLILPNGRNIFLFRPAVPQVGHRFLERLRKGLLEKMDLSAAKISE